MDNPLRQDLSSSPSERNGGRGSSALPTHGADGASSLQSIGTNLRERREASNLSLADVEKATRIRQKYLAALEADEWHLLPGEVVGRGFLRNYANYLKLNTNELMERRRALADGDLARLLSKTSAGAALPAVRAVDYRPKDVDLEETPLTNRLSEYVTVGRDWFGPVVAMFAVVVVAFVVFWSVREVGREVALFFEGIRGEVTDLGENDRAALSLPTSEENAAGNAGEIAMAEVAVPAGEDGSGQAAASEPDGSSGEQAMLGAEATPTDTAPVFSPTAVSVEPAATPEPPTPAPAPTDTPEPPTPTPAPTDTPEPPTATPEPPTATPEPPTPPPPVAAANCPDARASISSPGANQTVSGVVPIQGSATHEQFQYYKLEFAPGAAAEGGYGYFDGTSAPVANGVLGNFNSAAVPNGAYTIQLMVVDQTGNYPAPCRVTVQVQN